MFTKQNLSITAQISEHYEIKPPANAASNTTMAGVDNY